MSPGLVDSATLGARSGTAAEQRRDAPRCVHSPPWGCLLATCVPRGPVSELGGL